MWDFQDGKSMEEAAAQHKITIDVLKYSVDLILQKTGETLDQFRQNKALNLEEHPGPKSEDYISRLQRAVNYFKQKSGHSLYEFASANQISLFDLTDELIKELEIENKISSLKPVTLPPPPPPPAPAPPSPLAPPSVIVVSQHQHHQQQHQQQQQPTPQPSLPLTISLPTTPVAPSALTPTPEQQRPLPTLPNIPNPVPTEPTVSLPTQPLPPPGTSAGSSSSSVFSDSDATTILSDIDELIRDDTAELSHVTISTCPQTGDLIANNNNDNEVQAVISVNICNVCKKLFLDPKAFQEHESAGCIDF